MSPAPPDPELAACLRALTQDPLLRGISQTANHWGQNIWLCGGTLRDGLLGRQWQDLDLAADGSAMELGRAFAQSEGGRHIALDQEHDTCRIVIQGRIVDLAGLRGPDIISDLRARDFTVNAIAINLKQLLGGAPGLLDPTGGRDDLAKGLLRPAGPGVLRQDPLRVLRAGRFAATHGLGLADGVLERLQGAAPGLAGIAAERIAHEWLAMMAGAEPHKGALVLDQCGALGLLVPELEAGRGMDQNPYHHLDVLEHSLACLEAAVNIRHRPDELFGPLSREIAAWLEPQRQRACFMTAALLHDIGKPPTRQQREPGWASFYRHDVQGGQMAGQRCRQLGLSRDDSGHVAALVGGHMRPFHLLGAQSRGQLTLRGVRRLVQAVGDDLPGLFALAMADTVAGRGALRPADAEERLAKLYQQVARMRDEAISAALAAPPLINGNQLMSALGLEPGPEVGRLLSLIREAQLDGKIGSAYDALALARRTLCAG